MVKKHINPSSELGHSALLQFLGCACRSVITFILKPFNKFKFVNI